MKTRLLKSLPTSDQTRTLDVELYYSIGGMNFFTGNVEPRGLYLSVTPVSKGIGFKMVAAFTGTKVLVKELTRYSKKAFETFTPEPKMIQRLIDHVLAKNNLTLA